MNNKLINIAMFAAGAAIGSVVTWKLVKAKYEQITQEEIDSMREYYEDKYAGGSEAKKMVEIGEAADKGIAEGLKQTVPDKPDIMEYAAKIKDLGYSDESKDEEEEDDESMGYKPYVISPDEYDENGYDTESLTYYADGVLTDSYNEIVEDVEDMIGVDSLDHFGEFEDDSVFVRNDDRRCDYEILKDYRNYADVFPSHSTEE